MNEYPWHYRCSICQMLVEPDDVRAHTEHERSKPGWPGHMSLTRVDGPVKATSEVWAP